ncbi:MAG TPA: hypothetical protein VGO85_21715 [Caldimonas sp.]|nr:hypothetical protein [Caldimonas sp.]
MARVRYGASTGKDASKRGRAAARQSFLAEQRGPLDAEQLREALRVRRRQQAEEATADTGTTVPAPRGRRAARAAPDAAQPHQWLPIGPSVVLAGQAGGRPRVAGRVRDLQVSSDGRRAYAATANGGVWYSDDAGETWRPLGGWTTTGAPPPIDRPSSVLACGCLLVRFDAGGNAGADEVYVGTGELIPVVRGRPFPKNSGVGVLHATGPATSAIFAAPWTLEGNNLAGSGIFRLAEDPPTQTTLVAATSAGLWTRSGGPAAAWSQVAVAPFAGATGAALICTDVRWVAGKGATPERLWVAVRDDAGVSSGVFVSANGVAGPFNPIALPALGANPGLLPMSRISLASAPSDPSVMYALGEGNQVWRFDNLVAVGVERIPPNLLGTQSDYDQAIAVHPTRPERLVLGGATEQADGQWSASLYLASVTQPAPGRWRFGFTTVAAGADPTTDDSFIGHGVHADIHATRFITVGARTELWIGCDGGVFRSLRGDDDNRLVKNSFIARNTGMATLECGYVATHPAVDGHVLAGAQDNGTLERIGVTLWGRPFGDGDGGAVVFDPAAPDHFIAQVTNGTFRASHASFRRPVFRSAAKTASEIDESANTEFYTGLDAVLVPALAPAAATSRIAWGSWRVWMSGDSGATWRSLPTLGDPLSIGPPILQDIVTDPCVTTGGARDLARGAVIACRWASPTRLYVLCRREVLKFELVVDLAATSGLRATPTPLAKQGTHKKEDPAAATDTTSPGQRLPEVGSWSDIAVHDPGRGAHGSFYVAATGDPATPAMDTVWWFDGIDRWHATGLRTSADAAKRVPAPAYAVVVDKTDRNTVYVGTAVGVWRGVFDPGATRWDWFSMNNGLPEAAVQDLSLHDEAATGQRVLRAAIQARGVWEVDLAQPNLGARTMLRVHAWDTRRQSPTPLTDPKRALPNALLSWHASPDVRVRPRRGSRPPAPAAALPWIGASPDRYGLWVFQTALRVRGAGDPLVKADGQWTPLFDARVRAANANSNRVTQALWNSVVGSGAAFPNAYAEPWSGAEPSEADLFELIVDRAPSGASPASIGIGRVHARVDVQVHHRAGDAIAANAVRVTLLRRDVTGSADPAWAALPCAWTAAVQALLRSGGATPALADGWTFADAAQPVRSPSGPIDARLSRTVSFDADFSGLAAAARVLLVAVVHSDVDPVTLAGATLQTVVLGNRFVALRSVEML